VREIQLQGHGAVVIDTNEIASVITLRRFRLEDDRIVSDDGDALLFEHITALVRVATATSVIRVKEETVQSDYRGQREHVVEISRHEQATASMLYIFAASGPPWILGEREAKYIALGSRMRSTAHENFTLTIELLRSAAPRAIYDERFANRAHDSGKLTVKHGPDPVDARHDDKLHVLVHALVRWLTRGSGSLYRDASTKP
jgi:hypothetical protein